MDEKDIKYTVDSITFLGGTIGLVLGIISALTYQRDFYESINYIVNSTIYGTGLGCILGLGVRTIYNRLK